MASVEKVPMLEEGFRKLEAELQRLDKIFRENAEHFKNKTPTPELVALRDLVKEALETQLRGRTELAREMIRLRVMPVK